ncbi:phosphoenolpyruvate synthase [Micromonospora wenchangensis]|uniref:Rifampicin phosphotransferase n=1 Tax=Micromonospora wenchangensis TaxID=1185415 RepID=A0A246RS35_9ACTN|nr:rifamycin-inactivating phosphotransferase [Micromonospora wenchangensis]OWV11932.1 phosphoenolpyruvate synthase [Micromonospora wenchangensis]
MSGRYVLGLCEVDPTQRNLVGGKGAHLGGLTRLDGVRVPAGFCVTTDAFRRVTALAPGLDGQLDRLARLAPTDRAAIGTLSAQLRRTVEDVTVPDDVATEITRALEALGGHGGYAVRSSATAEDLPTASFAGQQDSYLNVVGPTAVLRQISRCWGSLFTARAVTYRQRNGIDHRRVAMAVVVQRMVPAGAAGVLFTADPVTGNRRVSFVEAGFGLGEALISGLVDADVFRVRDDRVVARTIAAKRHAVRTTTTGGTRVVAIDPQRQDQPALTDPQVVRLVRLGRRIEAHFGQPQDVEWCLVDDDFQIVQTRPVTTLFPVPVADDNDNHVYVSVGHQQMMTDPMKPLGYSMYQLIAARPMYEAAGRLFADVTPELASPTGRVGLLAALGRSDPLIGDALRTVVQRGDFVREVPDEKPAGPPAGAAAPPVETDPALVTELIRQIDDANAALRREIRTKSGPALLDFIRTDFPRLTRMMIDPRSIPVIMAGMEAVWWLNEHLQEWLGERNAADPLTQSVPHNVTSEMGLALLDVADAIRPYPQVVAFLHRVADGDEPGDDLLAGLRRYAGGPQACAAIGSWLDRYGMRGVGEIDITRPRWRERPAMLVPLILGNVRNFAPGAGGRHFAQGLRTARDKEREVLERLRALPDGGADKAERTKRMIDRARTFVGYREYPKYGMVTRTFAYKQALLGEADRLVAAGVLRDREDIWYLTLPELDEVVRTHRVDDGLVRRRMAEHLSYQALTPPRVLTSEGEIVAGAYRRDDVPAGALVGLAVSAGTVEGRARVVGDVARADLAPGDILVTRYTDPSWTPLFVAATALVTEVGGLMTHGAVIAREYGLPAVVGVVDATRLIRDGQRIRVHGTDGYVELLP